MPAKYAYCRYGHPRPLYMEACPVCAPTNVTKPLPTTVTPDRGVTKSSPVTNVTGRGFGTGAGRKRHHATNAERQAAHRERSQ